MMLPSAYVDALARGPFPGRIDPWAEAAHYFQQIHAGMIDGLITQLRPLLLNLGYRIGREASLQIAEGREPDIFVQRAMDRPAPYPALDYDLAAVEILAAPGVLLEGEIALQAIHIRTGDDNRLVSVIEVISPGNKREDARIADYRRRRERLILDQAVHVVEIDLTRSVKRLLVDREAAAHPYHAIVFLAGQSPRFYPMTYGAPLHRVALPLRTEVAPMELQAAYTYAYQQVTIGAQIHDDGRYTEAYLPFPSLLSDDARREALAAVEAWQTELARLRENR